MVWYTFALCSRYLFNPHYEFEGNSNPRPGHTINCAATQITITDHTTGIVSNVFKLATEGSNMSGLVANYTMRIVLQRPALPPARASLPTSGTPWIIFVLNSTGPADEKIPWDFLLGSLAIGSYCFILEEIKDSLDLCYFRCHDLRCHDLTKVKATSGYLVRWSCQKLLRCSIDNGSTRCPV